jgi:hypothetical protein
MKIIQTKHMAAAVMGALLLVSHPVNVAFGDGWGYEQSSLCKEVVANYCDTDAQTCNKLTYSPSLTGCTYTGNQHISCQGNYATGTTTYYPGTCNSDGSCAYGTGQSNPYDYYVQSVTLTFR